MHQCPCILREHADTAECCRNCLCEQVDSTWFGVKKTQERWHSHDIGKSSKSVFTSTPARMIYQKAIPVFWYSKYYILGRISHNMLARYIIPSNPMVNHSFRHSSKFKCPALECGWLEQDLETAQDFRFYASCGWIISSNSCCFFRIFIVNVSCWIAPNIFLSNWRYT